MAATFIDGMGEGNVRRACDNIAALECDTTTAQQANSTQGAIGDTERAQRFHCPAP